MWLAEGRVWVGRGRRGRRAVLGRRSHSPSPGFLEEQVNIRRSACAAPSLPLGGAGRGWGRVQGGAEEKGCVSGVTEWHGGAAGERLSGGGNRRKRGKNGMWR